MGVYLRGRIYHYKHMIEGRTYYRSLKIHKGQEPLLSGRIKQVDDEITALHFGLIPPARGTILFSEYVKKYLDRKERTPRSITSGAVSKSSRSFGPISP
jgi:hypothetical protein